MTKNEAEQILDYIANKILAPMHSNKPAHEVWEELIGTPFSTLSKMIYEKVENNS